MNVGRPTRRGRRRRPRAPCGSCRAAAPVAISANTASASTPRRRGRSRTTVVVAELGPSSWRAVNRARCTARNRSGKWSRTTTPACRARRPVSSRVSQMSGSPSSTWTWPREKGTKVTSQSAPPAEPVEDVLVGVAGERAAVVPGDGERWKRLAHVGDNVVDPAGCSGGGHESPQCARRACLYGSPSLLATFSSTALPCSVPARGTPAPSHRRVSQNPRRDDVRWRLEA